MIGGFMELLGSWYGFGVLLFGVYELVLVGKW